MVSRNTRIQGVARVHAQLITFRNFFFSSPWRWTRLFRLKMVFSALLICEQSHSKHRDLVWSKYRRSNLQLDPFESWQHSSSKGRSFSRPPVESRKSHGLPERHSPQRLVVVLCLLITVVLGGDIEHFQRDVSFLESPKKTTRLLWCIPKGAQPPFIHN